MFRLRFFIAALLLSLAAGLIHDFLSIWVNFALPVTSSSFIPWFGLAFAPMSFALSVALPFAVMHFLGKTLDDLLIRPAIVSVFLGCWIGQVTSQLINFGLIYLQGGSYGGDILWTTLYFLWSIFAAAFSSILFISLTAILLARYLKSLQSPPAETSYHNPPAQSSQ